MPNIHVTLPQHAFPGEHRRALIRHLTDAAATVEQMPDEPRHRMLCWVQVSEVSQFACGGADLTDRLLPCLISVQLPIGVLDGARRQRYAKAIHEACQAALPATERRTLATSVLIHDVADGTWGANGELWRLPEFVEAAGYRHLADITPTATP